MCKRGVLFCFMFCFDENTLYNGVSTAFLTHKLAKTAISTGLISLKTTA
jgi:hypothetical protein